MMQITYHDGIVKEFQLPWKNAYSGFVAGDLAQDLEDTQQLFENGPAGKVKSITFLTNRYFDKELAVELQSMKLINEKP